MTNDREWSEWVSHDGKGCPLQLGTICLVVWEDPNGAIVEDTQPAPCTASACWDWANFRKWRCEGGEFGVAARIIRYRTRKPSALTLLERIAADPQPIPGDLVPA